MKNDCDKKQICRNKAIDTSKRFQREFKFNLKMIIIDGQDLKDGDRILKYQLTVPKSKELI